MIQILDRAKEQRIMPLFRLAFRPFFLGSVLFSAIAMTVWGLLLSGSLSLQPYGGSLWWHAHEMLFGFVNAVIVGFLLTAVQTWTGIPGVRGWPLAVMSLLWLIARLVLWLDVPAMMMLTVDISWMLMAAWFFGKAVVQVRQWRNLFFVPALLIMCLLNGLSYRWPMATDVTLGRAALYAAIYLIAVIIMIMGGRVIPFFTARGTQTEKPAPIRWLEYTALMPLWGTLILAPLAGLDSRIPFAIGALLLISALANAGRASRWLNRPLWAIPLLWSLHLAYWCVLGGIGLLGLSLMSVGIAQTLVLHLLTVGGIGGIILAMIARVSLGHTGRPLSPSPWMSVSFVCLFAAAMARVAGPWLLPAHTPTFITLSALLWIAAMGLFVLCYGRILTQPRADGHPG